MLGTEFTPKRVKHIEERLIVDSRKACRCPTVIKRPCGNGRLDRRLLAEESSGFNNSHSKRTFHFQEVGKLRR